MGVDTGLLPLSLCPFSDLLEPVSPPDFVIRPFFPRGELTEVVGAHATGKSTLLLGACLAVATGRPWGGVPTAQGRAVFISLEDTKDTLARRVQADLDGIDDEVERTAAEKAAGRSFAYLSRECSQALLLTRTRDGVTEARHEVADHLADLTAGAALVVLETATRIHDGPETNEGLSALARALERIAANGAAVVIIRHVGKKAAREGTTDSYAGRGGSAFSDAVRSSLVVTRSESLAGAVTLTAAKTTHAQPGDTLTWLVVLVGHLGAVRMETVERGVLDAADAQTLLAYMERKGKGIVRSQLHKAPPAGLSRARAGKALDQLVEWKSVVKVTEERGRSKQQAEVYYPAQQARR